MMNQEQNDIMLNMSIRIQVTVPDRVADALNKWADYDGRPLSNLCAFLLEKAVQEAAKERPHWASDIVNPPLAKENSQLIVNRDRLPSTFRELVQENYWKLRQIEDVGAIASGTVPTVDQVLQIAEILDLDSNELLELAKRTFPEGLPSNKLVN